MVQRVGVIGAGLMGSGIAEVAAKAGSDVLVWEAKQEFADAGKARIEKSLEKAVSRGKLSEEDRDAALGRLTFTTKLEDFADRELVMEAIIENEDVKKDVFAKLDEIVEDKKAPLCSNTSSLPIQTIASATKNPGRVLGLHFFNPVPVLPLVEVIPALTTDEDVVEVAQTYATEKLGKQAIRAKDRSGFIVNFLLVPYMLSAVRMVENGVATPEDIDTGMKLGANHPMGPLTLADMVGLDTCAFIADVMYKEFGDPSYACPPLLRRMVTAGHTGRKSGKGFYEYN
ncbi:3-hydroxybutyryl-CoA dehydrogenase [Corynebacterium jeikeium]|uniref:3-hydroxybutyryl-CoA dehydrogenase n=1 Tax=Corynebacterium jeikeium TaxID=38289 RepID=UPI0001B71AB6|nr:3-hydroxybutyryl-CoA dehydrogenase [Corynebacterium jeikeium]EEW16829.1 3-hydroxybutyryl-CoA dehydrogenase [Corynebacterium jeikeium ATCC 43734]OOD30203.1 3-hydroxybutyryl-CoA dehydrogenase [Corynebacterium jeikeium]WCZ53144.1 3-hydroxybutyryl-CoA dehydrogenase [Corynebacterium jeikeium]SUY81546.1 3-hydroxybutyryl-CoA dehydrogenase [Corynebacterium jeikeium]